MRLKKGRVDVDPLKTTAQALASRDHWMDEQSCRRQIKPRFRKTNHLLHLHDQLEKN